MFPAFVQFAMFYIILKVMLRMLETHTAGTDFGAAVAYVNG